MQTLKTKLYICITVTITGFESAALLSSTKPCDNVRNVVIVPRQYRLYPDGRQWVIINFISVAAF